MTGAPPRGGRGRGGIASRRGDHQAGRSERGNLSPIPLVRSVANPSLPTTQTYPQYHEQRDSPTYRSDGRSRAPSFKRDSSRDRSTWRDSGGRNQHRNSRTNDHSNYQQRQ